MFCFVSSFLRVSSLCEQRKLECTGSPLSSVMENVGYSYRDEGSGR